MVLETSEAVCYNLKNRTYVLFWGGFGALWKHVTIFVST